MSAGMEGTRNAYYRLQNNTSLREEFEKALSIKSTSPVSTESSNVEGADLLYEAAGTSESFAKSIPPVTEFYNALTDKEKDILKQEIAKYIAD